jgi:hypothetical protein
VIMSVILASQQYLIIYILDVQYCYVKKFTIWHSLEIL